jgi:alkylhydroperoxidase/carboxymuconolactone decarboxylase family protein YurZ
LVAENRREKGLTVPQLIKFAVNLAIGHEHGAKLHLDRARKTGASKDEVWETVAYAMRTVGPKVHKFAKE